MQPRFALRARGASKCQGYAWGVIYLGLTQKKEKRFSLVAEGQVIRWGLVVWAGMGV